jgi:hypothetical protein
VGRGQPQDSLRVTSYGLRVRGLIGHSAQSTKRHLEISSIC